jgi:hypothetical protein
MMKINNKSLWFSLILLIAFSLSGCGFLDNIFSNQAQLISGAVEVGNEWKEIVPPAPLKSVKTIQYVSLRMPESVWKNADWDESDPKRQTLKYGDGRTGKIEAILYDDKGASYELQINGKGGGFDLGRAVPARNPDAPPSNKPMFPTDRVYTKLKIRSDVPLNLEKIEWSGYNPK